MAMRTDCKHYESRTYRSGETVRKCRLDLAPEAPWRCPDECPRYQRRLADVGWDYGSLRPTDEAVVEPEPPGADVAALLDEAEEIVSAAGRKILSEAERPRRRKLFRRRKRR